MGGTVALSVGVFIDYQNAYNRAREAFAGSYASAQDGQFHPVAFGHLIASLEPERELVKVHTYRGQPDPRRDPKGAGACQRQLEAWRSAGVDVTTRPLGGYQYGQPKEKGIDVLLALDFVDHAMAGTYDIQVLVSADSDLVPALERAQRFADVSLDAWRGTEAQT